MSIKMLSLFFIGLIAASNAIPLFRSAMESEEAIKNASNEPKQDEPEVWDAGAFARLDHQLTSEELIPLARRIREILNYASRVDESALDSDSGIRLSNGHGRLHGPNDAEPLAMLFAEPIAPPSAHDSDNSGDTSGSNVRVKKSERSFGYYPSRG